MENLTKLGVRLFANFSPAAQKHVYTPENSIFVLQIFSSAAQNEPQFGVRLFVRKSQVPKI